MEHVHPPMPVSILRTSENIGDLALALAEAQGEFPVIEKNQTGKVKGETAQGRPYEYEYKYADIADVLAAVRPVLAKYKLAVIQPTIMDRNNLVVLTRLVHGGSGQWMESEYPVSAIGPKHQAMGGALTYARRYALCAMLSIAAEEDKDGEHVSAPESRHQRQQQPRQQETRRQERQEPRQVEQQPEAEVIPAQRLVNSIKRRTTLADLNAMVASEGYKALYAKVTGEDKVWVDTTLEAHKRDLSDPTADVTEPTPPVDPLPPEDQARQAPRREREPAPTHTPGRLSQAAIRTVHENQRKPSKASDLVDDEIPF